MTSKQSLERRSRRHYLAAMVLGTALATIGGAESAKAAEISDAAVTNVSRYCTACWRNARLPADRWNDCTQEVFRRLLERLEPADWTQVLQADTEERRELVRAIDAVKKRTQRDRKRTVCLSEPVADRRDSFDRDLQEERDAVNQAASELLTPRQQRILQLTIHGWGIADMAGELGLRAERVSDEKYKAIQKLRVHFHTTPS
ncbi:MAG: sigma-70 family RNA polymerase sigma factor [Planctomycetes bacterium]|nr:sigma-70 family RNA polymerase sigma factor [Planctomycetota bacterium]